MAASLATANSTGKPKPLWRCTYSGTWVPLGLMSKQVFPNSFQSYIRHTNQTKENKNAWNGFHWTYNFIQKIRWFFQCFIPSKIWYKIATVTKETFNHSKFSFTFYHSLPFFLSFPLSLYRYIYIFLSHSFTFYLSIATTSLSCRSRSFHFVYVDVCLFNL